MSRKLMQVTYQEEILKKLKLSNFFVFVTSNLRVWVALKQQPCSTHHSKALDKKKKKELIILAFDEHEHQTWREKQT